MCMNETNQSDGWAKKLADQTRILQSLVCRHYCSSVSTTPPVVRDSAYSTFIPSVCPEARQANLISQPSSLLWLIAFHNSGCSHFSGQLAQQQHTRKSPLNSIQHIRISKWGQTNQILQSSACLLHASPSITTGSPSQLRSRSSPT
jgi:hypothetical protein